MTKDDGGPAFPLPEWSYPHGVSGIKIQEGMSLRDWFAGMAMQGMLAHSTRYKPRPGTSANWHEAISEEAYQLADAMIAEGKKDE